MKRIATFVALLGVTACGPTVKSVTVDPPRPALDAKGATASLQATAKDADGKVVDPARAKVTWSSSDPGVATVDAAGTVSAVRSGVATIEAASGPVKGSAQVTVAIPGGITVAPPVLELHPDRTGLLAATVVDDAGRPLASPRGVVWSSSDPVVATVADGKVVAMSPGVTTVTAAVGALRATAKVEVKVPDFDRLSVAPAKTQIRVKDSLHLKVSALDRKGSRVGGVQVTWKSSSPQVATVGSDGTVKGVKKGKATITATAGKKSATATITVADAVKGKAKAKPSAKTAGKSKPPR